MSILKKRKSVMNIEHRANNFGLLFEHLKIQTNSRCTRKCPYCLYGNTPSNKIKRDVLADDVVYRIIDELHNLDYSGRLAFFEINEPLTDQRIFDFISQAVKQVPKAWHMLVSNGDLLTPDVLNKLYDSGLNQLAISVYDSEMMAKIDQMKNIGSRAASILEIMDYRGGYFPDNRGGNIDYLTATKPSKPVDAPCERVHKIMYVRPSGNAVSCFSDFFEINIMGNVYKNSLEEIWFGDKFNRLREALDNQNRLFSPLCSKCNYPGGGGYYTVPTKK